MKKEVIYFDAAAYGPFANCELTNGYLESVYMNMDEEASGESKKIKLDESKILYFWKRIDELNVWNWNKRYEDEMAMTDGYTWEVKLRNRDGSRNIHQDMKSFQKHLKNLLMN